VIRRRLFTIASAISPLLCVGIVSLWVRSYWVADLIEYEPPSTPPTWIATGYYLESNQGGVSLRSLTVWLPPGAPPLSTVSPRKLRLYHLKAFTDHGFGFMSYFAGFGRGTLDESQFGHFTRATAIPDWFPFVITSIFPLVWIRRRVTTRNRALAGLCPFCGYKLTGNTSGV
jgi:hypothetical protein